MKTSMRCLVLVLVLAVAGPVSAAAPSCCDKSGDAGKAGAAAPAASNPAKGAKDEKAKAPQAPAAQKKDCCKDAAGKKGACCPKAPVSGEVDLDQSL